MTHPFTLEIENFEFYDVTKQIRFDGSHLQLEQTNLLEGMEKVSNVSSGI